LQRALSNATAAGQRGGGRGEPGHCMVSDRPPVTGAAACLRTCPRTLAPHCGRAVGPAAASARVVFPGDAPLGAHPPWSPRKWAPPGEGAGRAELSAGQPGPTGSGAVRIYAGRGCNKRRLGGKKYFIAAIVAGGNEVALSWSLPSTSFMFIVNEAPLEGSSFPGSRLPPGE